MPAYRKKPVVVDAFRPDDLPRSQWPQWAQDALMNRDVVFEPNGALQVRTKEGMLHANAGDWLIRGVEGEIYPCKASIFGASYEPAGSEPSDFHKTVGAEPIESKTTW